MRKVTNHLIGIAALGLTMCSGTREAPEDEATVEARNIAEAAGLGSWGSVSHVEFTFTARISDTHEPISRSWVWSPKTGEVRHVEKDYTYNHLTKTDADDEVDAMFVNDTQWLLFPFQLVWTDDATLTLSEGPEDSPVAGNSMNRLTIQYPNEGGYTPGDAYDVFYGEDHMIQEWAYRKGGQAEAGLVCTWDGWTRIGGIMVATEHKGPNGFQLQISDIKIR